MQAKQRARRHAMAAAHARRQDNRREAETGIRASDRRRVLKDFNRERRGCDRALTAIVRGVVRALGG